MGIAVPEVFVEGVPEAWDAGIPPDGPPPAVAAALIARRAHIVDGVLDGRFHERVAPMATLYRHGPRALRRFPPAPGAGFHFTLRATRGADRPADAVPRTSSGSML